MALLKKIVALFALLLVILTCFSLLQFYHAIRPFKLISSITPESYNIPYENISFQSFDGTLIHGWWIPNKNKHAQTIILLHGYPADKGNILPTTLFLHKKYNLLYLDFRYFGQSGGHYSTLGFNEVNDVLAAIDYLKQKNIHYVTLWGFSFGGAVALMTASKTNAVNAVIADASFARLQWLAMPHQPFSLLNKMWSSILGAWADFILNIDVNTLSPMICAEKLSIPVLIIHSKNDEVIPFFHALTLQQALKDNHRAVFIFPSNLHHGQQPENYQAIINAFLNKIN